MRHKGRIVGVADYDAGDAFGAAVGVEGVGYEKERQLLNIVYSGHIA